MFHHSRPGESTQVVEDDCYSARIAFKGRRERFNTGEREKAAAAAIAAEIYRTLDREGWEAAFERFKPQKLKRTAAAQGINVSPTVGDFILAVTKLADVTPRTVSDYIRSFRQVVAGAAGIEGDASRFDSATGGTARWRERVDSVKLSAITPAKVQAWKQAFVTRNAGYPQTERKAKISANSIMRQAKSLFSNKRGALSMVRDQMHLPTPLPFDGVAFYPSQSTRYQSKIDAKELLVASKNDLAGSQPEAFKMLVLALCCGLRRNEIDKLTWLQVDLEEAVIRIETTRHFRAKSEDSLGEVDLDSGLVALMRVWKATAKGEFVIESDVEPRLGKNYAHYRANRVSDDLAQWLRAQGVEDRKALHTLRKEFGSLVAQEHGIYAASRALRHADIQVTAKHYLDKKQSISIGLGHLLKPDEPKPAEAQPESKSPKRSKKSPEPG